MAGALCGATLIGGFWLLSAPTGAPQAAPPAPMQVAPAQRVSEMPVVQPLAVPQAVDRVAAAAKTVAHVEWVPPLNPGQKGESAPLAQPGQEAWGQAAQAATAEQRQVVWAWRDQQANLAVKHDARSDAGSAAAGKPDQPMSKAVVGASPG